MTAEHLRLGDWFDLGDRRCSVIGIASESVTLRGEDGVVAELAVSELWQDGRLLPRQEHVAEPGMDILDRLEPEQRELVLFWVEQLQELEGQLGLADAASIPKSQVMAEAARRIERRGHSITTRSLYRKLDRYRTYGVPGLVHERIASFRGSARRTDSRVAEALAEVMAAQRTRSTGTRSRLIEQTRRALTDRFGDGVVAMPGRSTMYALIQEMDRGTYVTGSAKTRRSLANRPQRQFAVTGATRPGEQVQIDSTKVDLMIEFPDGSRGRPELTIMIDVATRSIIAAIIQPTTKSIDLVVLLARALTPHDKRPGGEVETRQLISHSVDHPTLDEGSVATYRRKMPLIFPSTITTDRGSIYVSRHFREVCQRMGIDLNLSAPFTPTDKAIVERTFKTINTRLLQHLPGYTGRGVEFRGAEDDRTLLSLQQLQVLIDDWIAVDWQERPHDALRNPNFPGSAATPNEIARAARQLIPEVVVPMDEAEYIRLMPRVWRKIQSSGVTIDNRSYDSRALAPYRRMASPHRGPNAGKWPIRQDPYNVQVVWLELEDDLIPLQWTSPYLNTPMSADLWNAHRKGAGRGRDPVEEAKRAAALADLLYRGAHPAKPTVKQQRAIARNDAVHASPTPVAPDGPIRPMPKSPAVIGSAAVEDGAVAGEEWAAISSLPPLGLVTDDDEERAR